MKKKYLKSRALYSVFNCCTRHLFLFMNTLLKYMTSFHSVYFWKGVRSFMNVFWLLFFLAIKPKSTLSLVHYESSHIYFLRSIIISLELMTLTYLHFYHLTWLPVPFFPASTGLFHFVASLSAKHKKANAEFLSPSHQETSLSFSWR